MRGYGLKIGTTISNQTWEYAPIIDIRYEPESRIGFNAAIFGEFNIYKNLNFVAELGYYQKGMEKDIPKTTADSPEISDESVTFGIQLDYLSAGIFSKLLFDFQSLSPYIIVGPKLDFEVNKSNTFNYLSEVEKDFEETKLGLKIGIGSEFKIASLSLLAEILYDTDFNNLYENDNLTITTNSFDIRLGIML
jgi:hypothetical protein